MEAVNVATQWLGTHPVQPTIHSIVMSRFTPAIFESVILLGLYTYQPQ